MSNKKSVLVVGLGEIGQPLLQVLSRHHSTFGLDLDPSVELPSEVDVMHVCYPFRIPNFLEETAGYIDRFKPRVTVLNFFQTNCSLTADPGTRFVSTGWLSVVTKVAPPTAPYSLPKEPLVPVSVWWKASRY